MGRVASLQGMMQRNRMGKMELDEAMAAKKEQQALQALFMETQGDMDKLLELAPMRGVRPQSVAKLKEARLKEQDDIRKQKVEERAERKAKIDGFGSVAGSILSLPPEQRGQAVVRALPALVQEGTITPQQAQEYGQLGQAPPEVVEQQLKMALAMAAGALKTYDSIEADEKAKRDAEDKRNERTANEKDFQAQYQNFLAAEGLEPNARIEREQRELYRQQQKERTAVPGVDVPLPPEVEKQKIRMAGAEARVKKNMDTAEDVANYADAVASGQMEITAVPMKMRGAVNSTIQESGRLIVSAKEREGIQALDIPLGIIADIEKYANKINTKSGLSARVSGAGRSALSYLGYDSDVSLLRSKIGTLSLLIRALGEKGTLAEGDINRAIALIPSVGDTKAEKDNKIRDLKQILSSAKAVKTKGAAQTFGATGAPQAPAAKPATPKPKGDPLGIYE